jgi:hypothetical protein
MNKKKAYTGMKTPVLMKVGNSAVLQVFRKTPQNRGWPHCPQAVSKRVYRPLPLWFLGSCSPLLRLRMCIPDKFNNFSKRRSLHSGNIPSL